MKSRPESCLGFSAVAIAAFTASANAEILSFNGNQAAGLTTHTINASNWADYVGGSGTFNSANDWGRLYWRGSSGDGQYMHFDLSTLTGLTVVSPAMVTLQNANPTWGGSVNDSFVATANAAWTAGGGQPIPGATAITNAVNATGSYGGGHRFPGASAPRHSRALSTTNRISMALRSSAGQVPRCTSRGR